MATRITGVERRPFDILGISEPEEHAYRWLLAHVGATVQQLSRALSLPVRRAQQVLDAIEACGLVTHSPERPRRYLPSPPDMAIDALILHQQGELQRARVEAQDLQTQFDADPGRSKSREIVELITSREAERQAFEQMQRTARSEVLFFVRPPMRIQRLDVDQDYKTQYGMRAKGISYRCLLDNDYLDLPGAAARVQSDLRRGIEIRVVPKLPSKLVLADRRIALMPLNPNDSSVLVRGSALLDTLYALFENLWNGAAPISLTRSDRSVTDVQGSKPENEMDEFVALLAMGINDKTIAGELGLSMRTLNRRIADVMKTFGARSRFQAGWLAASQSIASAVRENENAERTGRVSARSQNGVKTPRRKSAAKPR